nr:hypothetical protein StreXyl84_67280 [Streptomyces sp. Xyl84]
MSARSRPRRSTGTLWLSPPPAPRRPRQTEQAGTVNVTVRAVLFAGGPDRSDGSRDAPKDGPGPLRDMFRFVSDSEP